MATDNTEAGWRANPEAFASDTEAIPAARWGSPEDMGSAAVFLA